VPTGTLEVLTTDALGTALPGVSVQLRGTDREDRVLTWALTTNARGEALFEGVPGGTFEISLADPRTKQETKAKVNLIGGGKERKEFALSHPEERLAAAGLVVDERGGAVGDVELSATAEKKWYRFRSDQEGRFEFWLLPCERVRVLAPFQYPGMGGLNGPIYEPQEFEIPFGTNGLIFRRVGELELVEGMVTAVDRRTGKPVPGAFLRYEQTEPRPLTHTSSGNPVRLACYLVPSTRWAVHAPGYRTRYGLLAELLATEIVHEQPESGPDTLDSSNLLWGGRVFRVEMDLGFEREVAVLDAATKRPIRKAHFVAEDGAVFLTNSEGLVVLTAEQPSKHYIIQADGYERMEWDPDVAKSASRTILLTPRQD
jgi:hypothetical protein